jgi:hypothetical protein
MGFVRLVTCALALVAPLSAEIALTAPAPTTAPPQLFSPKQMRSSGMIFSGTVLTVAHLSSPGSPGITQIKFKVESAMRGRRRGQILRVREWDGLWNFGERYDIGQRVLLFLYPNSKLGLTSPVGGALGRYQIDNSGHVLVHDGSSPRSRPIPLRSFAAAIKRAARN